MELNWWPSNSNVQETHLGSLLKDAASQDPPPTFWVSRYGRGWRICIFSKDCRRFCCRWMQHLLLGNTGKRIHSQSLYLPNVSLRRSTDPPGNEPQPWATRCVRSWGEKGKEIRRLLFVLWGLATLFLFFKNNYLFLFLAVLGLRCCTWDSSSCGEQGLLFFAVHRPLSVVASLVSEHRV